MFTGIITDVGEVRSLEKSNALARVEITCHFDMRDVAIGASIACDGVCLTVTETGENWFAADMARETLEITTLSHWREGQKINLERALKVGDELGGHIVSGHVDAMGTLETIAQTGESWDITIAVPGSIAAYIATKGSITLDGISLTVNEVNGTRFSCCIIPHSWEHTTLSQKKEGDAVNIEVDRLARHAERILSYQQQFKGAA